MKAAATWIANGGLPAALIVAIMLAGCTTNGPSVPDYAARTNEHATGPSAKIALATTSTPPEIEAINFGMSEGEAAAINAPVNAAIGGAAGLAVCARTVIGLLVWPACLGVGAIAGAADGNTTVASSAYSTETLDEAETRARTAIAPDSLQGRMLESVEAYARRNLDDPIGDGAPVVVEAHDTSADYAALATQGFDAVLEVELTRIALGDRLEMVARARLVSVEDGAVIRNAAYGFSTPEHGTAYWMAADSPHVSDAVARGLESLAADIVDETFLLYYPPARPSPTRWGPVPYYALAPEYPLAEYTRTPFALADPALPHVEPGAVATMPATFRWERFPRWWDALRADGTKRNIENVRYEIKVFEAVTTESWSRPGPLVYQATDLPQPEHRVSAQLAPCTEYLWTVRARFALDGRTRVTEWSGVYRPALGPEQPPWRLRRSTSVPRASWFYPSFVIGGADGTCTGVPAARFKEARAVEARPPVHSASSEPRTASVAVAGGHARDECNEAADDGPRRVAYFPADGWTFGSSARRNLYLESELNRAGHRTLETSPYADRPVSDWKLELDFGEVLAGAHDLPGGSEYAKRLHREYAHLYAEKVRADAVVTFWYEQRGADSSSWQDVDALLIDMTTGSVHRAAGTPADANRMVRTLLCWHAE